MNKKLLLLIALLSLCAPVYADVPVNGDVWHMSGLAPENHQEWNKLFLEAENLSAQRAYTEARMIVDGTLKPIK